MAAPGTPSGAICPCIGGPDNARGPRRIRQPERQRLRGGATSGADYAAVANFDVTIAAGEASGTGTFDLAPTQGTLHEDTETIGVTGASRVTVTGDVISLMHDHAELGLGVCRQKRPVPLAMQVVEVQATQLLRGGRQVDDPRRRRELR